MKHHKIENIKVGNANKYQYGHVIYDSKEEIYFFWYLQELWEAGYIQSFEYQPDSYELYEKEEYIWIKQLKTKIKKMVATLDEAHIYTPDYKIFWTESVRGLFYNSKFDSVNLKKIPFIANEENGITYSIIEIKPKFDKHNMTRIFSLNKKWMQQQFNIISQKVIVDGTKNSLFPTSFVPDRYLWTDGLQCKRKIKFVPCTLSQFVSGQKG